MSPQGKPEGSDVQPKSTFEWKDDPAVARSHKLTSLREAALREAGGVSGIEFANMLKELTERIGDETIESAREIGRLILEIHDGLAEVARRTGPLDTIDAFDFLRLLQGVHEKTVNAILKHGLEELREKDKA